MGELIGLDEWITREPDWLDEREDEEEPTGSCDECGVNVYGSFLCDQCEFMLAEAQQMENPPRD